MALDFSRKQYPETVILMAVRYYVAYQLSYRDIEEILAERGIEVDHATLQRWVQEYAPQLERCFRKLKKPVAGSWRMDETYIKVKGKWCYLYRTVDKHEQTIDFMLAETRRESDALAFFEKAVGSSGLPEKVVIDKSGSNEAALNTLNWKVWCAGMLGCLTEVVQCKYLNNLVEQSHRPIKRQMNAALGYKSWDGAEATIAGVELWQMLRKGQMKNAEGSPVWEQFYSLAA